MPDPRLHPKTRSARAVLALTCLSWLAGCTGGEAPARPEGAILVGTARTEVDLGDGGNASWRVHPEIHSASPVVPLGDGWVALDHTSKRLHWLDADLGLVRSVGGPGQGPGELDIPVSLAVSGDSLVAVLDQAGARLSLFGPDGAFRGHLPLSVGGCVTGIPGELLPDPGGAFAIQGICAGTGGRWVAARIAMDGGGEVVASRALGERGGLSPPFGLSLMSWRGRLWTGTPDGCFEVVGEPGGEVTCVPGEPVVPFTDDVRAALMEGLDARMASAVRLPDAWPPVVAVQWSAPGPLLVLPTRDGEGVPALLRDDGSLVVLRGASGTVAPGRDGVLQTRTLAAGTGFRVVPWPGSR